MTALFDLVPTDDPARFTLTVERSLTVGPPNRKFLFGGVGLAAALAAIESVAHRPAIWASAQFVSFAALGESVEYRVEVLAGGNHTTQARATATVGDRQVLTVNAALGLRTHQVEGQWTRAPDVPRPEDCPVAAQREQSDGLLARFDFRVARGGLAGLPPHASVSDGRHAFWVRSNEGLPPVRALLAVMGDFLARIIAPTIGARSGGNSLDNAIRFVGDGDERARRGGWVLCDARIDAIAAGIVHGDMRMFDADGRLLAIAGQSMILRTFPTAPEGTGTPG